jgi:hypothetical protein
VPCETCNTRNSWQPKPLNFNPKISALVLKIFFLNLIIGFERPMIFCLNVEEVFEYCFIKKA